MKNICERQLLQTILKRFICSVFMSNTGSCKLCTHPHSPTLTHTQSKKGHIHPHPPTPAKKRSHSPTPTQKEVTLIHTYPHLAKKGHTHPHPPKKRSHSSTPTHTQPKKVALTHTHPNPDKKGHTQPKEGHTHPRITERKNVTVQHIHKSISFSQYQQVSSFLKKIDQFIFFY